MHVPPAIGVIVGIAEFSSVNFAGRMPKEKSVVLLLETSCTLIAKLTRASPCTRNTVALPYACMVLPSFSASKPSTKNTEKSLFTRPALGSSAPMNRHFYKQKSKTHLIKWCKIIAQHMLCLISNIDRKESGTKTSQKAGIFGLVRK